jgi:hypothetical protein
VHGTYGLSATSGILGAWRLGIQLDERERRTLNLTLKEAISIEGTLLMFDATPHEAVPVQAVRISESANQRISESNVNLPTYPLTPSPTHPFVVATTLSDESGKYRFINLKPGQYQVRCQTFDEYVYYGVKGQGGKRAKITFHATGNSQYGDILNVELNKTISNIDFRSPRRGRQLVVCGRGRNYTLSKECHSSVHRRSTRYHRI